jgi:hypothetical protein
MADVGKNTIPWRVNETINFSLKNQISGPKEKEILVDHAEGGVHRSRNRPMA